MTGKLNLGMLFGGRSCEHEVSITSARSILAALDPEKYSVSLIGIDKQGYWHMADSIDAVTHHGSVTGVPERDMNESGDIVTMRLHHQGNLVPADIAHLTDIPTLDVVFPVLHGTFGEDGTLQGILETAGIPYVGCGVAASALAMDKALAKMVFKAAGIPQAPWLVTTHHEWIVDRSPTLHRVEHELGYPVFVKPANLGSSVGVTKAHDRQELVRALEHAREFDNKVIVEQSMENHREIECSVLGNQAPEASILGEIRPGAEFYNYQTKYLDDKTELTVPAPLDPDTTRSVREMAIRAFLTIDGKGLARADFFVHRDTNEIILNEVNTMPGFTPISMYPRLWAASGLPYRKLIDRLVGLALEHHRSKQHLKRSVRHDAPR